VEGNEVSVIIYSNIIVVSERVRVHHYADLANIHSAVMDLSDSETCNLVIQDLDSSLVDLDDTSEDSDHICIDLEDQDSHRPDLAHILKHLDRISTDLEDHIPLHPHSVQT
jgi:hypothetical protein